jgi:type I restriction enzyme S subunit
MSAAWKIIKLADVCDFVKAKHDGSCVPYLGMENIQSGTGNLVGSIENTEVKSLTFAFDNTKLLYGRLRPYLRKVFLPKFSGHCSTEIFPIQCRSSLSKEFLFYWLISDEVTCKINKTSTGARMPRANMNEVINFDFPLPPLPEQKRIVAILDKVFAAIDKAIANTEKNLVNAKELFESYLNDIFEKKGEGWEEKRLGEVCKVVGGGTPSKANSDFYAGEIPWATVRDLKGDLISQTELCITEFAVKKSSTNVIPVGNVIIATRVGLGKVCLLAQNTAINQDLRGIIPNSKLDISESFLFWWFRTIAPMIMKEGTGATVKGVKLPFIKSLLFSYPKLLKQKEIVREICGLREETQQLQFIYTQKLTSLKELKQSILQKAFSGELTREDADV